MKLEGPVCLDGDGPIWFRRGDDADADPDHDEHGYNEDGGGVVELVHCVGF